MDGISRANGVSIAPLNAPISDLVTVARVSKLNLALVLFLMLQALDLATTLLVFSRGGVELNPVVHALLPWTRSSKAVAVFVCKAVLVIAMCAFGARRKSVLVFADVLYGCVVLWNAGVLVALL